MSRTIRTERQIDALIQLQATLLRSCDGCLVGTVAARSPDLNGCNWRVAKTSGEECGACLIDLNFFISVLKETYNLAPVSHQLVTH